jgi:hypothetical protein
MLGPYYFAVIKRASLAAAGGGIRLSPAESAQSN